MIRTNFFLKQARRHGSKEKSSKKHKSEDHNDKEHSSDKGRESLNTSENGEDRHKRKERKSSRGRSHSRSRSRERRHRSRSRDRKKSRSRSKERKRRVRSRSRSRSRHRHRSRSRSRTRSRSRERKKRPEKPRKFSRSHSRSPSPPPFRGRNTAMDAQEALARSCPRPSNTFPIENNGPETPEPEKPHGFGSRSGNVLPENQQSRLERAKKLQEQREKELVEKQKQQEMAAAAAATGSSVINVAALLASGTQVTPQIAMAAQMAALQAKALAETGIAVPSYYNPAAVNPMKFAEQEKKRKMLWQGKKEGDKSQSAEIWEKLNFGNKDQNVKFRKLMGIKSEEEAGSSSVDEESYKTLKQQEEVFRNLDAQYEMARSQTHTQRGMGLGFTSSMRGMDAV
ncbi:arginine/serine-rich coiled-coil protein 2 isoform X3 [Eublepharis macularius]|uniref:Arginine/serine-rich coiled-coil protein 2 n=1 Tax=Eublepharis macularius TaxID=481883 RepID=A0AA97LDT0_EUBMA|nr:arginine/serine-rich coiled-coil protein 2 isoform X3 [Eublepharis macularius]